MGALGFTPGDVITVTGGGSGIGRATALTAAKAGLCVAIWDLNGDSAAETAHLARALGGKALALTADVADRTAVAAAWQATQALGPCRYLVNNAGPPSNAAGPFTELLAGSLGSVELVTSQWLERCGEVAESVVSIASMAGNFQGGGETLSPFYPAAKAGIAGYTRWLATRHRGRPRANAVAPGFILTPRTAPFLANSAIADTVARIPMGRGGYPEELASAIVFLLSPAASYINGVLLPVDGAWSVA
jgi:NAD(P)-dependent dehydrogenase (short-subunit alcohol dehydrogenase family)